MNNSNDYDPISRKYTAPLVFNLILAGFLDPEVVIGIHEHFKANGTWPLVEQLFPAMKNRGYNINALHAVLVELADRKMVSAKIQKDTRVVPGSVVSLPDEVREFIDKVNMANPTTHSLAVPEHGEQERIARPHTRQELYPVWRDLVMKQKEGEGTSNVIIGLIRLYLHGNRRPSIMDLNIMLVGSDKISKDLDDRIKELESSKYIVVDRIGTDQVQQRISFSPDFTANINYLLKQNGFATLPTS